MQYLFLPLQFIGKAVSAALFGILLLIAFRPQLRRWEAMNIWVFIVMIIYSYMH